MADVPTISTPKRGRTPPDDWQARFLVSLAGYGNVSAAARAARISRDFAYDQRHADAAFAAAWNAALQLGTAGLEDEARRRAFEGVRKPVHQGGKLVGYVREYSDTLLIFLLKAHKPEVYRETIRNLNVNVTPEQAAKMTDDEIDAELRKLGLL